MENYDNLPYENQFQENQRPGGLTFLCILTFIGSGLSLLSYLMLPILAPAVLEILREASSPSIAEVLNIYEQAAATPIWQFYLLALLCATSIFGAIYMMKLKKIGFHIYTISQIAQIIIGFFLVGGIAKPGVFGIVITMVFVGLYSIYYKKFTDLNTENLDQDIN